MATESASLLYQIQLQNCSKNIRPGSTHSFCFWGNFSVRTEMQIYRKKHAETEHKGFTVVH